MSDPGSGLPMGSDEARVQFQFNFSLHPVLLPLLPAHRSLDQLLFPVHLTTAHIITSTQNIFCPFPLYENTEGRNQPAPPLSQVLQKNGPGCSHVTSFQSVTHTLALVSPFLSPAPATSGQLVPSFLAGALPAALCESSALALFLFQRGTFVYPKSEKLITLVDCHPLYHFLDKTFVLALQVGLPCIPDQSMGP